MRASPNDTQDAVQLVRDTLGGGRTDDPGTRRWTTRSLKGGLTTDLRCVSARTPAGRLEQFVLKRIPPEASHEIRAYLALAAAGLTDIGPRVLGTPSRRGTDYLLLEYVPRWKAWPWADESHAGLVLDTLARLHGSPLPAGWHPADWYPAELASAAAHTRDMLRQAVVASGDERLRRGAGPLDVFVARLTEARAVLLQAPVFLHGDVHPGNVLIRAAAGERRAVLVDWGRARLGSRFEDVSSWLQCLRYFERATVSAHDRLLLRYVRAAGLGERIIPALRREYWIAAGCNGVAGALGVHLSRVLSAKTPAQRETALAAAADWLRIVRRAAEYVVKELPAVSR